MERALAWRLGLSAFLIPALVGLFYVDHRMGEPATALFLLCLFLVVRGGWELSQLLQVRNMHPRTTTALSGCILILLATWWPHVQPEGTTSARDYVAEAIGVAVLALMTVEAWKFREPGRSMESLGAGVLIVVYVGLLLSLTAQLRWLAGAQAGYLLLGSVVVAAKLGDVGAYTVGRLWGRRKMAPWLSPGKTWAGFFGAIGGASLGSLLWLQVATPLFGETWTAPPVWACVVYGAVIGLAGLVGDLCESLIKRDVGRKDASSLMPGFGGLLDLLDSVLYAGPMALLLWQLLPLITWK